MITPTSAAQESADRLTERLHLACKRAGLLVEVIEPSTKLKICTPNGNEHMAETITLKPDEDEALTWFWSWGMPICPAEDIPRAVESLLHVIAEETA
jgi:hypothetical protein